MSGNRGQKQEPMSEEACLSETCRQREEILARFQQWVEVPMLLLGLAWLALFVVEMVRDLTPLLRNIGYVIWGIFIVDFLVNLSLAHRKIPFLKSNWLGIIALLAPAFRVLRVINLLRAARVARAAGMVRGLRLLRLLTSVNRGMKSLGATMQRRGFGYVIMVTLMVTVAGAAAMYRFEKGDSTDQGLDSFGTALWWTAMMMTTMGSQFWPRTPEGRILCLFLALYGFTVFGYVTATLASFFIGRDAENDEAEIAGEKSIAALKEEVAGLRAELARLKTPPLENGQPGGETLS